VNRRGFLKALGLAAGGVLLDQAIPNGRVWSFPKDIVVAQPSELARIYYDNNWKNLDHISYLFKYVAVTPNPLPLANGKTIQFYRYNPPDSAA